MSKSNEQATLCRARMTADGLRHKFTTMMPELVCVWANHTVSKWMRCWSLQGKTKLHCDLKLILENWYLKTSKGTDKLCCFGVHLFIHWFNRRLFGQAHDEFLILCSCMLFEGFVVSLLMYCLPTLYTSLYSKDKKKWETFSKMLRNWA